MSNFLLWTLLIKYTHYQVCYMLVFLLTQPNFRGPSNVTWAPCATIFCGARLQREGGDIPWGWDHRVSPGTHRWTLCVCGYDEARSRHFIERTGGGYLKLCAPFDWFLICMDSYVQWKLLIWHFMKRYRAILSEDNKSWKCHHYNNCFIIWS